MRLRRAIWLPLALLAWTSLADAQNRRAPAGQSTSRATREPAELDCPSELGTGIKTRRRFCDVLTGREPQGGVIVRIPPHRGPVTLSFDLHNRHTYSEELVKANRAFRDYTATIGVLTMDNTLVGRAVVQNQFRTVADLFDRLPGGAGVGGLKAVAPTGIESVTIQLPDDVGDTVSLVGEKLRVVRADAGVDQFMAPGRPIATVSNVELEYRPAPAARRPPAKKP